MKKSIILSSLFIISILSSLCFAQEEITFYYDEDVFPVSIILVEAIDKEDADFISASILEELIRSGKISIAQGGDTLIVKFVVQHIEEIDAEKIMKGRNGKWGELTLLITSKSGNAAVAAREYLSPQDGYKYFLTIKELIKNAAKNFVFQIEIN